MPRRPRHQRDRAVVFPRTVVFPLPRGPLQHERAGNTTSSSRNQSAPTRIATPDQTSHLLDQWKEVMTKLNRAESDHRAESDQMKSSQDIATAEKMIRAYQKEERVATKAERVASEMVKQAKQSLKSLESDLKGYNALTISTVNDLDVLKNVYARVKLKIHISGKLSAKRKAFLVKAAEAREIKVE